MQAEKFRDLGLYDGWLNQPHAFFLQRLCLPPIKSLFIF